VCPDILTQPPRKLTEIAMRADIHPDYVEASVRCSCGNTFTTRSTKPSLTSELCNECHPFYTGKQKLVDTGGRIDRFERRYGKRRKSEA
jgi:large subunit ribosomal protein L31